MPKVEEYGGARIFLEIEDLRGEEKVKYKLCAFKKNVKGVRYVERNES